MNRFIGIFLLSVLLGTGTSSLISIVNEMSQLDPQELSETWLLGEEEKIARGLARCERQLAEPEGREYELYRALRTHSEEDAQIFLISPDLHRGLGAQAHLRVLLHPRSIWLLDRLPRDWEPKARALSRPVYVVELDKAQKLPLAGACEPVAGDRSLAIWRLERRQD